MNLSEDFISRTQPLLGNEWDAFNAALDQNVPTSIRLNKGKTFDNIALANVPWCDSGYYLDERPQFTFDPLFHAGIYYVQEASSMFVAQAIEQYVEGDVKVLDLCAAPGGKSTLIADLISDDSLLVSNEVIRSRANILAENISKWGKPNTIVINNDPASIGKVMEHFFDVIVIDAPCSGEGMFRKDAGAIDEWSVANVELCKERQQRILADIWPALKSGGLVLYSTCTYNLEENEENVQWIAEELGAEILSVDTKEAWHISPSLVEGVTAYRFFPHKTKGEGFFFALLRKGNDVHTHTVKPRKNEKDSKIQLLKEYKSFLNEPKEFSFHNHNENWYAIPKQFYADLMLIKARLHIVSSGVCLGEMKGKDLIPDQSLAMSNALNRDAFVNHEVDWQTAINYLRKEALVLPDLPRGYILLTYNDTPLGFVKNIGNRANNLYPQEWRIRSANIPSQEIKVIK